MAENNGKFTETQKRMLAILADGLPHTREELHACLEDELGDLTNIRGHLSNIRKKLRPLGQDILCEFQKRVIHYRQVRLLASPYKE